MYVRVGLSIPFLLLARIVSIQDFFRKQLVQHTKPQEFLVNDFFIRCKFNKQKIAGSVDADEEVRTFYCFAD